MEGSLARDQSLGYSERASCTLSGAGQLLRRSRDGVLACKCSPCRVVVGGFCVCLLLKSDQFDFFGCWVPVKFFLGYLDTVKFLRSEIRGIWKKRLDLLGFVDLFITCLDFMVLKCFRSDFFFSTLRQVLQH